MKDTHDLDFGWSFPPGYKCREVFVGRRGRVEVEVIGGGFRVKQSGHLDSVENSRCLDWMGFVVSDLRRRAGK